MYGLLELDAWAEQRDIKIYCSQKTKEWLDKNFSHIKKEVIVLKPYETFELFGIKITTLPVYHMYYSDNNLKEEELNNTFGFLLEYNNKKVVYLPDYYKIPQKTIDLAKGSDVIFMDGTYLFEELIDNTVILKRCDLEDKDHYHGKQILKIAALLDAEKTVYFIV